MLQHEVPAANGLVDSGDDELVGVGLAPEVQLDQPGAICGDPGPIDGFQGPVRVWACITGLLGVAADGSPRVEEKPLVGVVVGQIGGFACKEVASGLKNSYAWNGHLLFEIGGSAVT